MSLMNFINDMELVLINLQQMKLDVSQTGKYEKYQDLVTVICQEMGITPSGDQPGQSKPDILTDPPIEWDTDA